MKRLPTRHFFAWLFCGVLVCAAYRAHADTYTVTNIDATGWPATNVDMIQRAWVQSSPEPRLPAPQQTGLQSE